MLPTINKHGWFSCNLWQTAFQWVFRLFQQQSAAIFQNPTKRQQSGRREDWSYSFDDECFYGFGTAQHMAVPHTAVLHGFSPHCRTTEPYCTAMGPYHTAVLQSRTAGPWDRTTRPYYAEPYCRAMGPYRTAVLKSGTARSWDRATRPYYRTVLQPAMGPYRTAVLKSGTAGPWDRKEPRTTRPYSYHTAVLQSRPYQNRTTTRPNRTARPLHTRPYYMTVPHGRTTERYHTAVPHGLSNTASPHTAVPHGIHPLHIKPAVMALHPLNPDISKC